MSRRVLLLESNDDELTIYVERDDAIQLVIASHGDAIGIFLNPDQLRKLRTAITRVLRGAK